MYYCAHWRRTFDSINALQAFYRMPKLFTRRNILSCIIFGSDLDPNGLPMERERERERERDRVCPSFRENQSNQCIGGSTRRVIFLN